MNRQLHANQCLIAALWATVNSCTALAGITQAVQLDHWLIVGLLGVTAVFSAGGSWIALRTRAIVRMKG